MRTLTLADRELHAVCAREQGILLRWSLGQRCPYGTAGETLQVQERLWVSDCGQWYAQDARGSYGAWHYDVIAHDGSMRYLAPRYTPTGWEDTNPRYLYPEFPHMVCSWGNLGRTLRSGRWIPAFSSGFGDYDTSVCGRTGTGNTQLRAYHAEFHRRLSGSAMPVWARRIQITLTGIAVQPLDTVLEAHRETWQDLFWTVKARYGLRVAEGNSLMWVLGYQRATLKDFAEGQCPHVLSVGDGSEREKSNAR